MAKLVFRVQSNWEEVVRLRNEIAKLKQELMSIDGTQSPAAFKALNAQLAASNQRLDELVTNAAKAGAEMETGFRRKIFDASQSVNGFTEKILAQKAVIRDIKADVKRLGDAYRIALKRNPLSASSKLEEYNAARKAFDEEKAALFGLTQQQAEARLSVKKLRDEYALYNDNAKEVVDNNNGIAISWKKALAVIGGAGVLKALGSEMIRVRGEFQSMQTAIETMVGKDMAGQLIPQIKELAKISPLTMSDMVGAEKMMLGFNIQAEDTIKYLKALSDISMGESSKFNSLTLAFSQMSAAGKLIGQDLNQMINAGFNPLQIISEKTGKSIATLKDEMSKGAISAEMVQQAFIDATSAGGKFYNMSENASKTINGQLSMMQDALDSVFNELGTKSESVIMDGIQMTTSLIENYETVGKVLAGLVVTYGTYRTAVILVTAAESKHTLVEIGLTNARILARKAQLALNAAMLTNPYVALATVVVGLGAAMWALSDNTTSAERAQKEYNEIKDVASKKEQEHKQKIEELLTASRDESLATLTRQKSLEELKKEYPKIFEQYDIEKLKLEDLLKIKQQINEEDSKRSVQGRKDDYTSLKQTISRQQRYLQLIENPKLQKNMSDEDKEMLRMYGGQKSYYRVRDDMEKNSELLKKYQKDVLDDNISAYKANLKNYSKERLEAELKLAQSSASKRNGFVVNGMMVRGGDLESIISSINGTLAEKKSPTTYKQDYDKAKKEWEDAKKKLSEIEKDKSKFTSKQYEEAKKREETTEKAYKNLGGITGSPLTKQENQTKKETAKQLKQQEQLAEQLLSLRRKNQQDEINLMEDGTEKKLAQIDLDYQKELDAIKKQKAEWEKAQGGKLTEEQTSLLGERASNNAKAREKAISAVNKEELEAMNRYLKEYGTFQQKKEAIAKEYADKIAKATTEGDKKILQKEMEEAIQGIDMSELKKSMDWEKVFGNLDKVSTDTLKRLKTDLKDFIATQKDLSPENLKELVDAIERIDDKVSERNPFEAMSVSFKSLKKSTDAQREAQEAYNKALKAGTEEEKRNAKSTLESAKNNKQKALSEATTALHKGVDEIGQYVDAGNQVIGIMETLGVKTPEWLEGTMSGFGEILNGLSNIDLTRPMSIVTGSLQTIKGALTSVVSLGGLIPGLGGADYSRYNDMVEEYTRLNEIWDELIDKKQEYIDISYGVEADKVGEEALSLVEKQIEAYRLLGKERLNSGASAGSHSIGKRMVKNTSSSDWQDIANALDMSVNAAKEFIGTGRMTGLFDLTAEQLEKLKSEAPAFWAKMDGDVQEYLNGIIEGEERIEDIQNQIKEQLTQTTFSSVFDGFVDMLMDMDSSAKDFSESFSGYMQRAVLTTMLGNKFTEDLQTWYDAFAQANKDKEGITKEEMEALRKQYDAIAGSALAERDKLAEIFGWTKEDTDSSTDNYEDFIDSMRSSLASLDVTAKDVSDNIYDYFRQAMINALYEKEYKSKMEELYKSFDELAKDGLSESDMAQLGSQVDRYIEQMMKGVEDVNSLFADKLKDAEDLQSFVDSVKSAMSSIEATAEDVTDNIFEYIRQQMVDKMFADTFQPQIEEFYKKVQKAMSDGDITGAEKDALRNEAEKLANDIVAAKDILSDTLGITGNNLKKELEEEFKSFSNGILSSLYDAEVTAGAVAGNISDSMRKELIEAMYIEQYEPRIKAIWEKWKEYSADGLVTAEERANIKNDIDELGKEVADAAKEISDAWTDSGEEVKKAFDSFSDSIKSVLYDAEATAEDVANSIYQYMRNALVDSMFASQLQPQIKAWYDKYTEFMEDGAIDTVERKTLDEMIAEIQKAGVNIVDAANKLFPTLDTGAINRAEEVSREAENARNEAEQEWESFSDGILNSLYDIEATAEDISDDMSEYMRKALIKAMYVNNFKPQMQKWYSEWQKAMGDDNLTSEEKQTLDAMKQTMVDDMKKEVNAINQFFGTMYSQQASSKGYETISQDTGEELNGRFTALQGAGEEIKNQAVQQTGLLSSINNKLSLLNLRSEDIPALRSGNLNIADRTREVIASGYQSQINVVFPTDDIRTVTDKVSNMERIVDELRTFQIEKFTDVVEGVTKISKNTPQMNDKLDRINENIKRAL